VTSATAETQGNEIRGGTHRAIWECRPEKAIAQSRRKKSIMLKKTLTATGFLTVTAAGAIIGSSIPAFAQTPMWGGGGCCGAHSRSNFFQHHRNRNWNGSENEGFNRIRLHIHNRNNNIATAHTRGNRDSRNNIITEPGQGGGAADVIGAPEDGVGAPEA
jgi:hypothetical protein